jgi:hypothetical protein
MAPARGCRAHGALHRAPPNEKMNTRVTQITTRRSRFLVAALEPGLPVVASMAYREFTDSEGLSWRVWTTVPSAGTHLRGGFEHGWLTFETRIGDSTRLRRLVPIPRDWESADEDRLELLCKAADEVMRHSRPSGGVTARGSLRDDRPHREAD